MALVRWLKQSTAVTIKVGPFVDETDGKTAETGLTLSQADFRLSKNGGDFAQKNESSSGTHDEIGYYDVALNTTDTGTLGNLLVAVHESGALPVRMDFQVVTANVWDSFFGADNLQVDTIQIEGGDATAALDTAIDTRIDALETAHGSGTWEAEAGPDEADIWSYATRTITGGTIATVATGAIDSTSFDTDAIDANALAADAVTEIQSGLATAAALTVVDDFLDTEIAALTTNLATANTNITTIDDLLDTEIAAIKTVVDAILVDTAEIGVAGAGLTAVSTDAPTAAEVATAVLTTQMTEAYASDGAAPTVTQALMLIQQMLGDFSISGTTLTVKKVDGSTTAATFTLNDASTPTSLTRAT